MMQNSPIRYTWDTREFRVLQYIDISFLYSLWVIQVALLGFEKIPNMSFILAWVCVNTVSTRW